jgi:hypothetical protein
MEQRKVLEYLEELAGKFGIEVVYERLKGEDFLARGGLCKVKGSYKVYLDRSEPIEGRIQILARALSFFNREDVYILPFIREVLDKAKKSGSEGNC